MRQPVILTIMVLVLTTAIITKSLARTAAEPDIPADAQIIIDRMVQYHFDRADRNNDGVLTKAEILAYAAQMFEEADLDGNNVITPEELTTIKQQKYEIIMGTAPQRRRR